MDLDLEQIGPGGRRLLETFERAGTEEQTLSVYEAIRPPLADHRLPERGEN